MLRCGVNRFSPLHAGFSPHIRALSFLPAGSARGQKIGVRLQSPDPHPPGAHPRRPPARTLPPPLPRHLRPVAWRRLGYSSVGPSRERSGERAGRVLSLWIICPRRYQSCCSSVRVWGARRSRSRSRARVRRGHGGREPRFPPTGRRADEGQAGAGGRGQAGGEAGP